MFAKKALSVAASLALAEQVLAFNAHRHHHDDKRALKIDVVTNYVTVTVYDGESVPAATPTPVAEPVAEAQYSPSTTTSTSIVVVPTPTPVAPNPAPVAPVPTTTLVTSVAPKVSEPAIAVAAVPSSSSQAAAATPAVSSFSTTGGKRGLAYNQASLVGNFFSNGNTCEKCSWAYNWDSKSNGLSASVEFVPMLWGPIPIHTDTWKDNANAAIKSGSTHMLSFNECDMPSQCNLDAATTATKHIEYMNPFNGTARIGAPAISNSNLANQGLQWLDAFVKACNGQCSFDFCVTHWYSPSDAAQTLFDHINSVSEICGGKPVWLTEFAPFGSDEQISSFVQTNIPKLDAMDKLERYSYFMVSDGVLVSGSSLSALGKTYAAA